MTLSLAEQTLLLLSGTDLQEPAPASRDALEARVARDALRSQVIGAWLMELLLNGHLQLKRPALYVQCRWCYLLLALTFLSLALAGLFGPVAYASTGALSLVSAVAAATGFLFLWYVGFFLLAHVISGRLAIEETPAQDNVLALVLERMRQAGQGKTCRTYFRHLVRFEELSAQMKKVQAHLVEQGYLIVQDLPGSMPGEALRRYQMNLNHPECQALREHLRAFLLTGTVSERPIAALTILLSPRVLVRKPHPWPSEGLYACFAPEEYLVLRAQLKAIKAQQDQALQVQLGVSPYQALLTIRNLLST
jgi:hypothetical protein